MKIEKLLGLLLMVILFACSSGDEDDDPSNPGPGNTAGKVKITGTSPAFTFWGEILTITGTGFSEVKDENIVTFVNSSPKTFGLKLTSADGDIEIVSATPTQLQIRVPFLTEEVSGRNIYRGEEVAQIEVAVESEKDTTEFVKFLGLPRVGAFEYHFGWFDLPGIARTGDSVILDLGFFGSQLNHYAAGTHEKLRLHVGGIAVPIKPRQISTNTAGFGVYFPVDQFSEVNCTEGANGWNDRAVTFTVSIADTDISTSRDLYLTYLPKYIITDVDGPESVSKGAGGNPFWKVIGEKMYFDKALYVSQCGTPNAEVEIATTGTFNTEYSLYTPLSIMTEQCFYKIYLTSPCGEKEYIGQVFIKP